MIETRLGDFEEVILLLTGIMDADTTYALRVAAEFEIQTKRSISVGAVHSALERLETKGFLKSSMGDPTNERGGRRKRIFTLTAPGKRALKESKDFKMALWKQYPGFAM